MTCDQVVLEDAAQAPAQIARVLRNCIIESRPIYIEVPRDQVFEPCDPVPVLPLTSECDADALDACADEIIEALGQATFPCAHGWGGNPPLRAGTGGCPVEPQTGHTGCYDLHGQGPAGGTAGGSQGHVHGYCRGAVPDRPGRVLRWPVPAGSIVVRYQLRHFRKEDRPEEDRAGL